MKILHLLLCYYPSQAGGPANSIYWLNNSLNSNFFSTEIISTNLGLVKPIDFKVYNKINYHLSHKHTHNQTCFLCCVKDVEENNVNTLNFCLKGGESGDKNTGESI